MRRALPLFCLAALAALPAPALAQRTTGSVVGLVSDESGSFLPGVSVTLKGDAVVGVLATTSNERGFYRFPVLPPGVYTLSYSLSGFASLNRVVKVSVGATEEENATLKLSQLSEEVTVTSEAPVVDTQSTQVSTNYDKNWVRNAPVPRFTFFDLINAAPGVNQSTAGDSRSTSLGSGTTDNSYQLDGTDFTAPLTGAAWPWPNTDAIEEIEVLSLGAPAEYGNLQGAVFNVVTRQGSNSFHGDANFYFQNQGLTSRNTTAEQDGGLPYHRDKFNDLTLQLSGPVVKDRLWFFASYQYQRSNESTAGTPAEFPAKSNADRMFFKLNYQLDAKNKLMFAYHDDFYRIPCSGTVPCSAVADPSTNAVEHGHNPSPNLTYTGVLTDKTYVEARISGFYGRDHSDPLNGGARIQTQYHDLDSGAITGGVYSWYDGDIWKTAVSAKVSHFSDKFLGGSHDFKFGVQYNEGGHDYVQGYNDLVYTYGTTPAFGYVQAPFHIAGKEKVIGVFADDTYRVSSRLSLSLGLRYDHSRASFGSYPLLDRFGRASGQQSAAVDNLYSWDSVSPRIGFNFKLTSDGKTALKAHYGRYYRGIITGEFDDVAPSVAPRYIFAGTYDAAGNPEGLELVSDNTNLRVDGNYKNPYTDQFIAGIERELLPDLGVAVNYVYKRGERYGGWRETQGVYETVPYVDDQGSGATGRTILVQQLVSDPAGRLFLLTNPPGMTSRYNGVSLQLTKRMSHNWQMTASLVVSKSEGRLGSSLGDPQAEQSSLARRFGQNPNDFINTDGRLIADRPVTGKVQFVYQLPKGFLLGLNFTHQSGRPWGRLVHLSEDLVGLPTDILAERLDGSRRVQAWNLLDLRAQKEFSLGKSVGVAVFADVLNLTNDDAYDGIQNRLGTSDAFGLPTAYVLPRRVMLGAKLKF